MKERNKKVVRICSMVIVFIVTMLFINIVKKDNMEIEKILSSESYSYLPKKAKNFIKEIYNETGNVVLTEKNKEENKPYLNEQYINYLSTDDKEDVSYVPEAFILDFQDNHNYKATNNLPAKYDLRNLNGNSYLSPMRDQGNTGLCWAIASLENAETFLMLEDKAPYNNESQLFSTRHLDYATSINGLKEKTVSNSSSLYRNEKNGSRELMGGGNFFTSSIAMANGITLVDGSQMPFNENLDLQYVGDILNYNNSKYEINSTIQMPQINADSASDDLIDTYVTDLKNYIIEYGAPFVGTYSPQSTCGFTNIDGTQTLKTDDCVNNNLDMAHAMQLVGWDDDYTYSYCDEGVNHSNVKKGTCSKGNLVEGKGAWILKNSWGNETEFNYVYLTYDSTRLSIGFITSMSKMNNRSWDNNYYNNPWIISEQGNGLAYVNKQTIDFKTHNDSAEKIEKIKFITSSRKGLYTLSIKSGDKVYNDIAIANIDEVGIYTFDLSKQDITTGNNEIEITIEGDDDDTFFNDSISVFTSNMDIEPSINTEYLDGFESYSETEEEPSNTNPLFVKSSGNVTLKLEHYIKNIDYTNNITYKVMLDGIDYSDKFFYSTPSSNYYNGYVYTELVAKEESSDVDICGLEYDFEILYDGEIIESIPLHRICNNTNGEIEYTKSKITLHKNDGSEYETSIYEDNTSKIKMLKENYNSTLNSSYVANLEIDSLENFFLFDKYIESWNTKEDGTGTTYTDNDLLIYKDIDLYAQWSDPKTEPHQYEINWFCSNKDCDINGPLYNNSNIVTFNKEISIPINTYENLDSSKKFLYWSFSEDDERIFYEEEKITNLSKDGFKSPFNLDEKDTMYLNAVWTDTYKTVHFHANEGQGNMKEINLLEGVNTRLKYNLFTKDGFVFKEWNTSPDGTGISYSDGQNIVLTENLNLYAIWAEGLPYIVKTYNLDIFNNYISSIKDATTLDAFTENIILNPNYTINVDSKIINGESTLYTGGKTQIYKDDVLYSEFTNIVKGDLNGDGVIGIADIAKSYQHFKKVKIIPENHYIEAGKLTGNSSIGIGDIAKLYQYLKGAIPSL